MDFKLTPSQQMTRRAVRDFVRKEVVPLAQEVDENNEFPLAKYRQALALELLELTLPEALGGIGDDFLSFVIALEEFASGSAALALGIAATEAIVHLLSCHGSKKQQQQYLPRLLAGETFGTAAIWAADTGGEPAEQVHALPDRNGYRLNGTLPYVPYAAAADLAVVFATVENDGICAFIVDKQMPGYAGVAESLMGVRGFPLGRLELDDVIVSGDQLLGGKESGQVIANALLMRSEAAGGAIAVGLSQAALEAAVSYAKARIQFGKPLSEMEATQNKIADMSAGIESARLLVYAAAFFLEYEKQSTQLAAMAKLIASQLAVDVCKEAVQIHGGYGYVKDYPVERLYRDALFFQVFPTNNEVQRRSIARHAYRKIR